MLRVTTLYASSAVATAAYYTRYLADAPGEEPGRWLGRQADRLGLTGAVEADDLQRLLEGRDPPTGLSLGRELADRTTADGRVVKAVAGFDATFSAPKSLSAWWALTGDPGLRDAHDLAVSAALAHALPITGSPPWPQCVYFGTRWSGRQHIRRRPETLYVW